MNFVGHEYQKEKEFIADDGLEEAALSDEEEDEDND